MTIIAPTGATSSGAPPDTGRHQIITLFVDLGPGPEDGPGDDADLYGSLVAAAAEAAVEPFAQVRAVTRHAIVAPHVPVPHVSHADPTCGGAWAHLVESRAGVEWGGR